MTLYLITKFSVETAWCLVGLLWFRRSGFPSLVPSGLRYGILRLALGWLLVLPIKDYIRNPEWLVWVGVLLPLRWMAWAIVGSLIALHEIRLRGLFPTDRRSNLWRVCGFALSTLSDLPAVLAGIWSGDLFP